MTSSFGSIAFGSLLVAMLEAMKQMCREAQRQVKLVQNLREMIIKHGDVSLATPPLHLAP